MALVFLVTKSVMHPPVRRSILRPISNLARFPFREPFTIQFYTILQAASWSGLTFLLFRRQLRLLARFLGPSGRTSVLKSLTIVFAGVVAYMVWFGLMQIVLLPGGPSTSPENPSIAITTAELFTSDPGLAALASATSFVAVPIAEELVFRGALFFVLLCIIGKWPAVATSALIFGYQHLSKHQSVDAFPVVCNAGFALIAFYILLKTGKLRWCMLFHAIWNFHIQVFKIGIPSIGIHF